jgi:hypothetical protein
MWSKLPTVWVCLLTSTAPATAMPDRSSGQSYNTVTEAASGRDNQPQPSKGWTLCQKLALNQVQAKPSANNSQNGPRPRRRSLCAL